MLRILYAADNRSSSFYSLERFLGSYAKYFNIKIAAYSKSSKHLNINWNLDALLDFRDKYNNISFKNSNFALFVREIKKYNPHLIISDLEVYSSYIGFDLGIPVWQVSPLLLYYGAENNCNIYKKHSSLFNTGSDKHKYIKNLLNWSNKKLILSHLGDYSNPPLLKKGYEWVRPNHILTEYNDSDVISNGISLADSYFAGKRTSIKIDYNDTESITVGLFNHYKNLSSLDKVKTTNFEVTIDNNIRFLSQYLKELVI